MSIIEDALKKAQLERYPKPAQSAPQQPPAAPTPSHPDRSKKNISSIRLPILILCLAVVLLVAGLKSNLFKTFTRLPQQNKPIPTPSFDEIIEKTARQSNPEEKNSQIPKFALNGIFFDSEKPFAIINNRIIEEGQEVKGLKVIKVFRDKVLVIWQDKELELVTN